MNENLDLTKILEGCLIGTKLYSPLFGDVEFAGINLCGFIGVRAGLIDDIKIFELDGKYRFDSNFSSSECLLFPSKDQRDWSKFERFWDKTKEERFDANTLQPFDKILVRDCPDELWSIEFFSHKTGNIVRGLFSNWCYTIPFNEKTRHLVDTRDDCPEYYKWWKK